MSIVLSGMLVTFSGIAVILAAIFVIPPEFKALVYAFFAIGWVFVIAGVAIRWYGMKQERKIDAMKQQK